MLCIRIFILVCVSGACCTGRNGDKWWIFKRIMAKLLSSVYGKPRINTDDLSEWMTNLPDKLRDLPLHQLSIPGSHDSGAFWLNLDLPVTPDTPKILQRLGGLKTVRKIIKRWSITQDLTLKEQLEKGIRYIDVRTIYLKSQDDFFTFHGLYGSKTSALFQQIKTFLDQHPKEVVILDFNHLLQFTPALSVRFTKLILSVFGNKLLPRTNKGVEVTINDAWKQKKQVIAFYPSHSSKFWSQHYINSPWYNTTDLNRLIRKLNERVDSHPKNTFNVYQSILTPSSSTIIFHITSSLKSHLALKCDAAIAKWLDYLRDKGKMGINIVICDFISHDNLPARVIRLNELLLLDGEV